MKKILALALVLCALLAIVACDVKTNDETGATDTKAPEATTPETDAPEAEDGVMSYDEYVAAEIDAEVVISAYVQATQSWWDNKITAYLQDKDGAYFAYNMACTEEDAAKLVPGTKIKVTGYKGEWAGEVEIMDATFEFVDGADTWIADAFDATALLGTDDLIKHQNEFVCFKGLKIEKIAYKSDAPGDDIYVDVSKDGKTYSFCVERYLTGPETEVYQAFANYAQGDVVDIEGFLYWYEGVNTHITAVVLSKPEGVMNHDEYVAADMDAEVVISAYVQATQSWWSNKITAYLQDKDGAYFAYEMACTEEDAAKLVPGTKIKVTGYKGEWAGEVEIMDATFEFVDGADTWIADAFDATALLGTDDLIKHQNEFVCFKGLKIEKIAYKSDAPGDDIYVDVSKDGKTYSFCVERYLTGPETDVYKAFAELKAGDIVDIEGFLYWYEGVNTHITKVAANG